MDGLKLISISPSSDHNSGKTCDQNWVNTKFAESVGKKLICLSSPLLSLPGRCGELL